MGFHTWAVLETYNLSSLSLGHRSDREPCFNSERETKLLSGTGWACLPSGDKVPFPLLFPTFWPGHGSFCYSSLPPSLPQPLALRTGRKTWGYSMGWFASASSACPKAKHQSCSKGTGVREKSELMSSGGTPQLLGLALVPYTLKHL